MDEISVAEDEGICNDERTIKTVAAPKLWNSLPLDIRNSGSISSDDSDVKYITSIVTQPEMIHTVTQEHVYPKAL